MEKKNVGRVCYLKDVVPYRNSGRPRKALRLYILDEDNKYFFVCLVGIEQDQTLKVSKRKVLFEDRILKTVPKHLQPFL